jgi:hypothetical protein
MNSYSKLMNILSGVSLLSKYMFLIQFLLKTDEYPLGGLPPPHTYSLFNSYSKLMNILSGVSLLIKNIFLIQFLLKTDEYPLWCLPPHQEHFPYSILIQN